MSKLDHPAIAPTKPGGLDLQASAQYLGVKPPSVRIFVRLGWAHPTRFGKKLIFTLDELDRLLREGTPSRPRTAKERERLGESRMLATE